MDTVSRILANAADVKAHALTLDTSNTEATTVAELNEGDVITRLGNVTFPFPFTLSAIKTIGPYGTLLTATHGWFTPGPVALTTDVTRVR